MTFRRFGYMVVGAFVLGVVAAMLYSALTWRGALVGGTSDRDATAAIYAG